MKEVIFSKSPQLDSKERRITDLHSVLNILHILTCELSILIAAEDSTKTSTLQKLENDIQLITSEIIDFDAEENKSSANPLYRIRALETPVVEALRAFIASVTNETVAENASKSLANIESIYKIIHVRLNELEIREQDPDMWISISTEAFERQFREVFYAIERNSKGRYRICFDHCHQTADDYYIDLKIYTVNGENMLSIPLRLIDVVRDLTANARKYTDPGGRITFSLYQGDEKIEIIIEDNGCGIPEDEIGCVIEFGYRASNVKDRPTMGGGFGLTKAAWLIDEWGGQLSITSSENQGTTLRFSVPNRAHPHSLPSMLPSMDLCKR